MTQAMLSLDTLNQTLGTIAMRPMNQDEFATFLANVDMSDIIAAIKKSRQNDQGAIKFIRKQIASVFNGWSNQPANDAPQPAASPAPAQSRQHPSTAPAPGSTAPASQNRPQRQSAQQGPASRPSTPSQEPDDKKYFNHKVYGTEHVIGFYANDDQNGHPCIYLECARMSAVNGQRRCHWDDKLTLKITQREMPEVMQVLLGYKTQCSFKHHGENKDKGFEFEKQAKNYYLKVFAKGRGHNVPMYIGDANYVFALFLKQWLALHPWMTDSGVMMQLRYICN